MPRKKKKLSTKKCPGRRKTILDLIRRKLWNAVELRLVHSDDPDPERSDPRLLRYALIEGAPPHIIADLIAARPENAEKENSTSGWIPLHYACRYVSSLETVQLLLEAFPRGIHVFNKAGERPRDCFPTSKNPTIIIEIERIRWALEIPPLPAEPKVTINQGVGGGRRARQGEVLEKEEIVSGITVYTLPLQGFFGAVGGLHSIVAITYSYRGENHFKIQDSVWVERVGETDESGNNVKFTSEPTNSEELTLFRTAKGPYIKQSLSVFEVLNKAKTFGYIRYCVEQSNCHILAMDLFNFCLSEQGQEEKWIYKNQIPNRFHSLLAANLPLMVAGSSSTGIGSSTSRGNYSAAVVSCAVPTDISYVDPENERKRREDAQISDTWQYD